MHVCSFVGDNAVCGTDSALELVTVLYCSEWHREGN